MRRLALLAVLVLLAACRAPEPEPTPPPANLGQDPAVRATAGEARAGVVRDGAAGEAALFAGIGAEGQAGDVKIYNDRVQFLVGPPGRRHGWIDVGGTLVDADLVRPEGELGRDALDDFFLSFGISRLYDAETVEIVSDGSDGGAAVVRTVGRDASFDLFVRGIESPDLFLGPQNLAIVRDYVLEPDADSLRVHTTFTNDGPDDLSILPAEGFMYGKEDFGPWFAGRGLVDGASGDVEAAGYAGLRGEGVLSLWPEEGTTRVSAATAVLAIASLSLFNHERLELGPGESAERVLRVGLAPDTASAEADRLRFQGAALAGVSGTVSDADGPVAGARVHFVQDGAVFGYARTDAQGAYAAEVPPGEYDVYPVARHAEERLWPLGPSTRYSALAADSIRAATLASDAPPKPFAGGRWTPGPTAASIADGATVDLTLPAAGHLTVDADTDGAIFDVVAVGPTAQTLDPDLSEALGVSTSPRVARVWSADGHAELAIPPGTWRVVAGHGWRHERDEVEVEITAGGAVSVELTLVEAVPRDGWVAVDTHLHAAPSMDGRVSMEGRLIACASSGLEVPVTTDHDRFADYRPLAAAMGLERLEIVPGTEVTTIIRGHANLYPVEPDTTARNGGGLVWWDREPTTTQDLYDRMRAWAPEATVQLNHGRESLGMPDAAGFTAAGPDREDFWSWDFDVHEIVTAGEVDAWRQNRDDWFAFINLGAIKHVVGSSDTHSLSRTCGFGHTDVQAGDGATAEEAMAALQAGRTIASTGVSLRASLDDAGPGETLAAATATLSIAVRGPSWVQPGVVRVYRNGVLWQEQALDAGVDGLIAELSYPVDEAEDAWFAVEVDEGAAQGHAWGGHPPYALTNALFLDADGGGWTAPDLPR